MIRIKSINLSFDSLIENRNEELKNFEKLITLQEEYSKMSSKLFDKGRSEAEESIFIKKLNDLNEQSNAQSEMLLEKYKFATIEIFSRLNKLTEKEKNKSKSNFLEKAFDSLKKDRSINGIDQSSLFDQKCIKDRNFNESCLKDWISDCSKKFISKNKKLGFEYIDDDLESKSEFYKNSEEFVNSHPNDEKYTWASEGFQAIADACWFVSAQGFEFQKKEIYFKDFKTPQWIEDLPYSDWINSEDFSVKCPDKPNKIIYRINTLKAEKRISKYDRNKFNSTEKRLKYCQNFVAKSCKNVERIGDLDVAFNYVTKGCNIRQVTNSDVQQDIQNFKLSGMTDADIKSHSRISEVLTVCKLANGKEYFWDYEAPRLDKKQCLKDKN